MALAGDLRDIQLPNLIQLLCSRRRSSAILFEHDGESGSVYIREGELIDATAGTARGEAAVFELLRWHDATFRVVDARALPTRSVDLDWRQLLLEGVRKIDENQRESDIEDAFVELVSTLEQLHVRLRRNGARQRPRKALRLYVELIHQTLRFCESTSQIGLDRASLDRVLHSAAPDARLKALLEPVDGRLSPDKMEEFFRISSNGDRVADRIALGQALLDALEEYLRLIVDRFVNPDVHGLWAETCAQLVRELRGELAA